MSKFITITISPAGEVKVEAEGFVGPECERATRPIERALGPLDGPRHKKPSYGRVSSQQPVRH